MRAHSPRLLVLALFFGSGLCALAYETVWVRLLSLAFGVSVYAVSTVLAAFMAGLCVGALAAARFADRYRCCWPLPGAVKRTWEAAFQHLNASCRSQV